MDFALTFQVEGTLSEVEPKVTAALMDNGFGVLTRIDVRETLRNKIGVETSPYVILGACNPRLAHQALENQPALGVFLPCSVCLKEEPEGIVTIWALNPETVIAQTGSKELVEHGQYAREFIESALKKLK
ncbi:MAG: DUF302 domain-containing protein [bacterium]|nr:DUF302 domain-containing protein [bacterium]